MDSVGAFYTPPALVAVLVDSVLARWNAREGEALPSVLDPSCGEGAFLRGVAERLLGWASPDQVAPLLHGLDVDARALERARAGLEDVLGEAASKVRLVHADALLDPPTWGPFDWVLGNPPWVSSVRQDPVWRAAVRSRYATARGNWDSTVPFVERSLAWTRPGGLHGFVVPNAFGSAPYARLARGLLEAQVHEARWDWSEGTPFGAAAYPIAYLVTRADGPVGAGGTWPLGTVPDLPQGLPRLEERAQVCGAATVAEAYALKGLLVERARPRPGDLRVLNSGTLDPGRSLWGERDMRYLGTSWRHPVVPRERLDGLPERRLAQARTPKVVVAGLTRRIEAFVDLRGEWLAAKSTTVVFPHEGVDLAGLGGALDHDLATAWIRSHHGGQALRGGYLRIGPPQLRPLPLIGLG